MILADEPVDPSNPNCEECISLPHKYPHVYCDGNKDKKYMCITFPKTQTELEQLYNSTGLRFLKIRGPICYEYESKSFPWTLNTVGPENRDQGWGLIATHDGSQTKTLFDYRDLISTNPNINPFIKALNAWNNICERTDSPEGKESNCCIKIRFSDLERDFNSPEHPGIKPDDIAYSTNYPSMEQHCNSQCERFITINITSFFTEELLEEGWMIPRRFFITRDLIADGSTVGGFDYEDENMKYVDMYTLIMHEMGHLLGFSHLGQPQNPNEDPCNDIDNTDESVMYKSYDHNERKELSWRDKCAYKRMYCCSNFNVSVQELLNETTISNLYPNPTNTTLTIPYSFETSLEYVVFAVDGAVVQTGIIPEGSDGFTFDVSSLSNGAYTLVLNSKKPIFRKFVISK